MYIVLISPPVKNTGDVGCLSGEWDYIEFNVFVLKEPDCNIMMMSKISCLAVP